MKITDARTGQRVRVTIATSAVRDKGADTGTITAVHSTGQVTVQHDRDGAITTWNAENVEVIYPEYDAILRIDQAMAEYGGVFGRNAFHDLRVLWRVQGLVDREDFNTDYTEAQAFCILANAVNLDDDERWNEASYQHETDLIETAAAEQGLLHENPDEYALHFGVVGFLTLPEPDRANLAHALRVVNARLYQDEDRFAEWGEHGLLDGEDVTRVADRAGHMVIYTPGYASPDNVWRIVTKALPGMVFLTPEQIAETGGPTPDHPYVVTDVNEWSRIITIY